MVFEGRSHDGCLHVSLISFLRILLHYLSHTEETLDGCCRSIPARTLLLDIGHATVFCCFVACVTNAFLEIEPKQVLSVQPYLFRRTETIDSVMRGNICY
jgi:hypothetical protein